jgi:hypothetical protein
LYARKLALAHSNPSEKRKTMELPPITKALKSALQARPRKNKITKKDYYKYLEKNI